MPEVTTAAGGKITGILALTFETTTNLELGTPVHVSGDYRVAAADGTKQIVGIVSVPNKKRVLGAFPSFYTPGVVTVEAQGFGVRKLVANAAIVAGDRVRVAAGTGKVAAANPTGTYAQNDHIGVIGIALMAASGVDQVLDVLLASV